MNWLFLHLTPKPVPKKWKTHFIKCRSEVIELEDAAYVVRRQDGKVKVKQASNLVGAGAWGGAFWGMLIGLLFFAPWLGLAVGAITGAIAGKATDVGIDDKFIKQVGDEIEHGNSALFLLVVSATWDKVEENQPAEIRCQGL